MPKRVDSDDEEGSKSRRKRKTTRTTTIGKNTTKKSTAATGADRTRNAKRKPDSTSDSLISTWAKRQTFTNTEGIDDVELASPKRAQSSFQIANSL